MALRLLTLVVALFAVSRACVAGPIPCEFTAPGRVVVISDVFADYEGFVMVLTDAGLIDREQNWIGGDAHLVQTGDILPRDREWARLDVVNGGHERPARLLMKLQGQAREAGGDVHALMGVLDALMLRWRVESLDPSIFERFVTDPALSQERVDALIEAWAVDHAEFTKDMKQGPGLRENFFNFHRAFYKPGSVEFYSRTNPETELGAWMRSRNTVIRINDVLYAHAGVSPRDSGLVEGTPGRTLQELNDSVREVANAWGDGFPRLFLPVMADLEGPIFWRTLPVQSEADARRALRGALAAYGARAMVVGVAPNDRIDHRNGLFFVNSNLGSETANKVRGALVIEGDAYTIMENGRTTDRGQIPAAPEAEVIEGQPQDVEKAGGGPARVDPGKR